MTAGVLNDSRVLDDSRGKLVDGGGKPRMVDVGVLLLTFTGLVVFESPVQSGCFAYF